MGGDPATVALVCSALAERRTALSRIVPRSGPEETFWADPPPEPGSFGGRKPLLIAGAALLALWPYAGSGVGAAVVQPAQTLAVTLPAVARIERVEVSAGQGVRAGQTLLQASTPAIERQEATARAAVERLQREVAAAALGGEGQARWGELQAELQTARAQAAQAAQDLAQLAPTAPFDAVVTDVDPSLAAGTMSPPAHQALLHLAAPQRWEAVAYVDETVARSLRPGQAGWIGLDSRPWTRERATVVSITAQPSATIAEPLLVRANGGAIAARETNNGRVLRFSQCPEAPRRGRLRPELGEDGERAARWGRSEGRFVD